MPRRPSVIVRRAAHRAFVLAVLLVPACGAPAGEAANDAIDVVTRSAPAVVEHAAGRPRVVILGDSLTAGLGLTPDEAYPAILQRRIDERGWAVDIVGAGVSGDTTAGGLRRLDWVLDGPVRLIVIALGGNDGLRGLPVDQMRANLEAIVEASRARGIEVVLAGMEAPPNFGDAYTSGFREVFETLGRRDDVVFIPFLLEGVAGVTALNQDDGIHPNADGAVRVAEHLWPTLEPRLAALAVEGAATR